MYASAPPVSQRLATTSGCSVTTASAWPPSDTRSHGIRRVTQASE